ncbi:PepSY-associated TM helix domain-containing protein [Hymenobacter chitinivorans]|uniref:Putative iron-regulated membrane protein n=1 Tax=Hymenobacter chitinivorans DSM 11115 TaxID=1121954 RepID=A0A2M9ASV8_9BACT|nr:PepSY-associated TM helix domain-containing protein [Hymenobacter chitinivorans]PJJ48788.1 putative iron-regulated membrane protein [Hymenobacter chitinivorans DSM 11115]
MTTFRKAVGTLHLWLGLSTGLVVFIVSLTGAIFTFQDEIRDATQAWRKVEVPAQPTELLLPSRLQAVVEHNHPGLKPAFFMLMGPDRSAVLYTTDKQGTYFATALNPYTGQELGHLDLRKDFFSIIQALHMYLLLPEEIGGTVVGISVLVFVVMLITGIILWWPKRKTDRKRSFTIKWGARWRRVNYDLHNVLGFYAASIALILALTGLMMSFEWVMKSVYFVSNAGQEYPAEKTPPTVDTLQTVAAAPQPVADVLYQQIRRGSPAAKMIFLGLPTSPKQPVYSIAYERALYYYHRDEYYFHPVSGQLLKSIPHSSKSNGQKMADVNYDLHTGQVLGLGGKILAFLGSLISASLPVTGFMVWWGRRKKPKKQRSKAATV